MALRLVLVLVAVMLTMGSRETHVANKCLSKPEILDVAQMASVMGIGAAL